ncbi:hypothetical protein F8568_031045 [Actinomadura sp. LD22]|uniref:WD40 repeat domain-containing protein n=1 Tax=Actinomadura physcomitrii TaxID=2650748 RepID=A0A6I4MG29_9ACTN|nr:hypothetical protein [Actinomadura physcomitrii]
MLRRRALLAAGAAGVLAAVLVPVELLGGEHGHPKGKATAKPSAMTSPRPATIRRTLVAKATGHVGAGLTAAVLSPDGRRVGVSDFGTVQLLNAGDMSVRSSSVLGYGLDGVVYGRDGKTLLKYGFGGHPERILLWLLDANGRTVRSVDAPGSAFELGSAAVSPDGTTMAYTSKNPDGLSLLGFPALRIRKSVPNPSGNGTAAVFSPDGRTLAVGGVPRCWPTYPEDGGPVCLVDASTLTTIATARIPGLLTYSLAFSRDGRTLAAVGGGQAGAFIVLMDAATLRTIARVKAPGGLGSTGAAVAGFTPDGELLAGCTVNGRVRAWLVQTSTLATVATATFGPSADDVEPYLDLSADGRRLLAGYSAEESKSAVVRIFEIADG